VTRSGRSIARSRLAATRPAKDRPMPSSLEEYESLAHRLAREPQLLAQMRRKLQTNQLSSALFDAARFRRNIEAAYLTMWETWQRGEPPRSFAVNAARNS
jgi:protein O-GlcNAc transferase